MTKYIRKDSLVWGFLLIIIGTMFLLDTLNIEIWDLAARLWPVALILWGVWKLYFGIKEKNKTETPPQSGRE